MYRLLFILFFFCCTVVSAQKIQYSKGSVKEPGTGFIRLIAGLSGHHHLIHFTANKKPVIHIFNERLTLDSTITLNFKLPESCDVKLIQFHDYYILYTHTERTAKHQLFRINSDGTSRNLSFLLNKTADSAWNKSTATYQLFKNKNRLCIINHTYHKEIKQIKTTIVLINRQYAELESKEVFIPFDYEYDYLKEVSLYDNKLLVLKTTKDLEEKNILTLLKIDALTGAIQSKQFESGKYPYYDPAIRFRESDSSIFLSSLITIPVGYNAAKTSMFMVRLNFNLQEITPAQTIQNIFKDDAAINFFAERTNTNGWLSFMSLKLTSGFVSYPNVANYSMNDYSLNTYDRNYSTAVRITLLNKQLVKVKDSLIKNDGNYYKIHPWPYSHFILQNIPYLLLVQELKAKRKALVLVYPDGNDELETIPVRAYNRYNFVLQLLQVVDDNYFIVPFMNKKEMGLMKVTLNN